MLVTMFMSLYLRNRCEMKDRADGCGFAAFPPGWVYIV